MKSHDEILRICSEFSLTQHEIADLFFKLEGTPSEGDEVRDTIRALEDMEKHIKGIQRALKTIKRIDPQMYERFHQDDIDEWLGEIGWRRHIEASKIKQGRNRRITQWYIDRSSGEAKYRYAVELSMKYSTRKKSQPLGLLRLAQFWIEHYGEIPMTRGHEFFEFAGRILFGDEVRDATEKVFDAFRKSIVQTQLPAQKPASGTSD